jgi:vancomycin resistance protein YoaR
MAGSVRNPPPTHVRREELVRPAVRRREFSDRVAQRYLRTKERPRWQLIAYAVLLFAVLIIGSIAYTTYAFSKYRGVIVPGVYVASVSLSGLTPVQATHEIENIQGALGTGPVELVYGPYHWDPQASEIGLQYDVPSTVDEANSIGRSGSFLGQLLDRLPLHRSHNVALQYTIDDIKLKQYIRTKIAHALFLNMSNANLTVSNDHIQLVPSVQGQRIDVAGTVAEVHSALGYLTRQVKKVPTIAIRPVITDAYAIRIRDRVEAFLSDTPLFLVGKKHKILTSRNDLALVLSFRQKITSRSASLVMDVNSDTVRSFVTSLAQKFDRLPQNAHIHFYGNQVKVSRPFRLGRSLNQGRAVASLLQVITGLRPHARVRLTFTVTKPPIDQQNPASYGINTWLGTGVTGFSGAGSSRSKEIAAIASRLNDVLLPPKQGISFNTLVGTDWPSADYVDHEVEKHGELVPGPGGAMQQVATTLLRALWVTGLRLEEHWSHPYRLGWYEPPIGLDAVVLPNSKDLRFSNNTGKYLLLETRYEPIRQELYVDVYGPPLKWKVEIDNGTVMKTTPHEPDLVSQDPSLATGKIQQVEWAHDGAVTVIRRTITYPNGDVKVDQITTRYQPWRAVVHIGATLPTPTVVTSTPTVGPSPTTGPSPTPTFNH